MKFEFVLRFLLALIYSLFYLFFFLFFWFFSFNRFIYDISFVSLLFTKGRSKLCLVFSNSVLNSGLSIVWKVRFLFWVVINFLLIFYYGFPLYLELNSWDLGPFVVALVNSLYGFGEILFFQRIMLFNEWFGSM